MSEVVPVALGGLRLDQALARSFPSIRATASRSGSRRAISRLMAAASRNMK